MQKLKNSKTKEYLASLLPGVITFVFNCMVYYFSGLLISPDRYIFPDMAIDRHIPFIPEFVIIYYLSFLQWLNYFLQACRGPEELRNRYFSSDILAKVVCFAVFLIWPVAMRRPDLPQDGNIWIKILSFTYGSDVPSRAFPSLHCFYSWTAFRYSMEAETAERRWISCLQGLFSLAVFASTVLVKQHYFIDIIGGIAFAEIALQTTKRTGIPALFGKMMRGITSRICSY